MCFPRWLFSTPLCAAVVLVALLLFTIMTSPALDTLRRPIPHTAAMPLSAEALCPEPPLCHSARLTPLGRLRCTFTALPLARGATGYESYVLGRLRALGTHAVKGQYVLPDVSRLVQQKLRRADEPLVLHFAGDNGVGKTTMANVISLAFGQRCAPHASTGGRCERGDSTLDIAGNAFDGLTVKEFRRTIVRLIATHARRFPHNGVVIINELTSLEPDKVRVLSPLLGRGRYFPEFPDVPLSRLTVVLTTDFGREGRTRGKNVAQLRALIDQEFRVLYSDKAASSLHTFPFMPIALETAAEIVRLTVDDLACMNGLVACQDQGLYRPRLSISNDAVAWIVEKASTRLLVENGRAVAGEVESSVAPLLDDDSGPCTSSASLCLIDLSREQEGALALYRLPGEASRAHKPR